MPDAVPASPTASSRRRLLPRTLRGWLAMIFVPVILFLLFCYLLVRATPGWYRPLDPTSQQVIDTLAVGQDKMGPELHNSLQRVPLGDQMWTISQAEVNSVLAYRFAVPAGAAGEAGAGKGRTYPTFSAPFVMFTPGKITLAARSTKVPGPRPAGGVVSVAFTVSTLPGVAQGPPRGVVKIEGAWLGALRVPTSLVEGQLRAHVPEIIAALNEASVLALRDPSKVMPQVDAAIRAIEYGEPFDLKGSYDHRVVIVKEVRVDDGSLTLIFGPERLPTLRPEVIPPTPVPAVP